MTTSATTLIISTTSTTDNAPTNQNQEQLLDSSVPANLQAISPNPSSTPLDFTISTTAVNHNSAVIKSFDYDVTKLLAKTGFSTLTPGAEFRPLSIWIPCYTLFYPHPHWPYLKHMPAKIQLLVV
jgi:hypothetical protein